MNNSSTQHKCQVLLFLHKISSCPCFLHFFSLWITSPPPCWADICWLPLQFQGIYWEPEVKREMSHDPWPQVDHRQAEEAENKSLTIRHLGECFIWVCYKALWKYKWMKCVRRPDILIRLWRWLQGHQIDRQGVQEKAWIEAQKIYTYLVNSVHQCGKIDMPTVTRNGAEKQAGTKLQGVFQCRLKGLDFSYHLLRPSRGF